jgi:hypothetical protein
MVEKQAERDKRSHGQRHHEQVLHLHAHASHVQVALQAIEGNGLIAPQQDQQRV